MMDWLLRLFGFRSNSNNNNITIASFTLVLVLAAVFSPTHVYSYQDAFVEKILLFKNLNVVDDTSNTIYVPKNAKVVSSFNELSSAILLPNVGNGSSGVVITKNISFKRRITIEGNVVIQGIKFDDLDSKIKLQFPSQENADLPAALVDRFFIINPNSSLTLINLAFANGASSDFYGGGAILMLEYSKLVIESCVFTSNTATAFDGGAIFANANSVLQVRNSLFQFNAAPGGSGGAIFITDESVARLELNTFFQNSAAHSGGAIKSFFSFVLAADSTFDGNTARKGGAISSAMDDGFVLNRLNFVQNVAENGNGVHLQFYDKIQSFHYIGNSVFSKPFPSTAFAIFAEDLTPNASFYLTNVDFSGATFALNFFPSACGPKSPCSSTSSRCFASRAESNVTQVQCDSLLCSFNFTAGSSSLPICNKNWNAVSSPLPVSCWTSGGYAPDHAACVFPFTLRDSSTGKVQVFHSCLPVGQFGAPFFAPTGESPRVGDASSYWCPTTSTYDVAASNTRKLWGYCSQSCGYVDGAGVGEEEEEEGEGEQPTHSPSETDSSLFVVSAGYTSTLGNRIEIVFSADTNCGKIGGNVFPCSSASFFCKALIEVANFDDLCVWSTKNTLVIYPATTPYLGEIVLKKSFLITAAENSDIVCDCAIVRLADPTNLIMRPSISLISQPNVPRCRSKVGFTLDATASNAFVLGGFSLVRWELLSVNPPIENAASIIDALNECSDLMQLQCTPNVILPLPGKVFSFGLRVVNSFGLSSIASVVLDVVLDDSKRTSFELTFVGGASVSAPLTSSFESQTTKLQVVVAEKKFVEYDLEDDDVGRCLNETQQHSDGSSPPSPLLAGYNIVWSLSKPRQDDLKQFNLSLASVLQPTRDPHVVLLDPSRFSGGVLNRNVKLPFDLVVKATLTVPGATAHGDLLVRVVSTPLVLVIENSNRTLSSLNRLEVVGTVVRGGRFAQEALQYVWTCQEQSPPFAGEWKTCNVYWTTEFDKGPDRSTAYLLDANVTPNTLYLFRFSAFSADGRSSETFGFFISPQESTNPLNETSGGSTSIEFFAPDFKSSEGRMIDGATARVNTQNRLRALGSCVVSNRTSWALLLSRDIFQPWEDISTVLRTLRVGIFTTQPLYTSNLQRPSYLLRLLCNNQLSSEVQFISNSPPMSGRVGVGVGRRSLAASYQIATTGWTDQENDLPFEYKFFFSAMGNTYLLSPQTKVSVLDTPVPINFEFIGVYAVDSLGAVSIDYASAGLPIARVSHEAVVSFFADNAKKWTVDILFSPRSGVIGLQEMLVSAFLLDYVEEMFLHQTELLYLFAVALVRLANIHLSHMLLDDFVLEFQTQVYFAIARFATKFFNPNLQVEFLENMIASRSFFVDAVLVKENGLAALNAILYSLNSSDANAAVDVGDGYSCAELMRILDDAKSKLEANHPGNILLDSLDFRLFIREVYRCEDSRRRLDEEDVSSSVFISCLGALSRLSSTLVAQLLTGEDPIQLVVSDSEAFYAFKLSSEEFSTAPALPNESFTIQLRATSDGDPLYVMKWGESSSFTEKIFHPSNTSLRLTKEWLTVGVNSTGENNNVSMLVRFLLPARVQSNESRTNRRKRMRVFTNEFEGFLSCERWLDSACEIELGDVDEATNATLVTCTCEGFSTIQTRRRLDALDEASPLLVTSLAVILTDATPRKRDDPLFPPSASPNVAPTAPPTTAQNQQPVIIPVALAQDWGSALVLVCAGLLCCALGLIGFARDATDRANQPRALAVFRAASRVKKKSLMKRAFLQLAHPTQRFVFPAVEGRATKRRFLTAHLWLAPLLAPYAFHHPRPLHALTLFSAVALEMGLCALCLNYEVAFVPTVFIAGLLASPFVVFSLHLLSLKKSSSKPSLKPPPPIDKPFQNDFFALTNDDVKAGNESGNEDLRQVRGKWGGGHYFWLLALDVVGAFLCLYFNFGKPLSFFNEWVFALLLAVFVVDFFLTQPLLCLLRAYCAREVESSQAPPASPPLVQTTSREAKPTEGEEKSSAVPPPSDMESDSEARDLIHLIFGNETGDAQPMTNPLLVFGRDEEEEEAKRESSMSSPRAHRSKMKKQQSSSKIKHYEIPGGNSSVEDETIGNEEEEEEDPAPRSISPFAEIPFHLQERKSSMGALDGT